MWPQDRPLQEGRMRKIIHSLAVAIALTGTTVIVGAQPASAAPCGFSEDDRWAYWTNCQPYTNEYIHIDVWLSPDDYICVPAQSTERVGSAIYVRGVTVRYNGCPA
ncbi:DUF6355 family natural product biosynthesis protein [Nonomuraea cypriaca]|uniref:DUF6355 family natural product biosynthesis protein n=1 Tax=Nonomuraea cypriaca TaxID=1187855 RepID=UPI0038B35035